MVERGADEGEKKFARESECDASPGANPCRGFSLHSILALHLLARSSIFLSISGKLFNASKWH
jgi:hypothetical protein